MSESKLGIIKVNHLVGGKLPAKECLSLKKELNLTCPSAIILKCGFCKQTTVSECCMFCGVSATHVDYRDETHLLPGLSGGINQHIRCDQCNTAIGQMTCDHCSKNNVAANVYVYWNATTHDVETETQREESEGDAWAAVALVILGGGAIAFIFVVCAIFGVTAQDAKSAIQAAKSAILMHGPTALLLLVISLGLVMIGKVIRRFRRDIPLSDISDSQKESDGGSTYPLAAMTMRDIPLSEISETQKESNTRGSGEATLDPVASAPPHRVYYVKRGSAVRGPFSLKKIRALDSAKKLKSNDELSRNGDGPWVRYATVYRDVREGKAPKLLSDSDTSSERGSGDIGSH